MPVRDILGGGPATAEMRLAVKEYEPGIQDEGSKPLEWRESPEEGPAVYVEVFCTGMYVPLWIGSDLKTVEM
jgi:hypothetical protein